MSDEQREPAPMPDELADLGVNQIRQGRFDGVDHPVTIIYLEGGADVGDRLKELLEKKISIVDELVKGHGLDVGS